MTIATEDRCVAIIKWTRNWRCERRAVVDGLCRQHSHFGARVPAEWEHHVNDHGVLTCNPQPPIEQRKGTA